METATERNVVLDGPALDRLVELIRQDGYRVAGPKVVAGTLTYGELGPDDRMPRGLSDDQSPGRYRLNRHDGDDLFLYAAPAQAWKTFLTPPDQLLFVTSKDEKGIRVERVDPAPGPWAFVGVRPCDLAAIARRDRIFLEGPYPDPVLRRVRDACLLVVAQCTAPAGTCFCASMGTGPGAASGYDIALTELPGGGRLVAEAGSERGANLLRRAGVKGATPEEVSAAARAIDEAAGRMGKGLETEGLRELLMASAESLRWEAIARRCLACGNCTMACPTCFCSTVEETSDLSGARGERWRRWDSCFSLDFSYIHGGSVRRAVSARYRQWMTHKLATWVDQFGEPGCVGCGRCITWCPAGIDLTEEARAFRKEAPAPGPVT